MYRYGAFLQKRALQHERTDQEVKDCYQDYAGNTKRLEEVRYKIRICRFREYRWLCYVFKIWQGTVDGGCVMVKYKK